MVIWIDFVDRKKPRRYWIDQHFDNIEDLADYVFSREVLIAQYQISYDHQNVILEDDREQYDAIAVDKITEVSAKF